MNTLPIGPDYGFGLYVHWPYCTRICPYCDFNVYAAKNRDTASLVAAIRADIERQSRLLPNHPPLDSLFFGGGTPSLLSANDIESILETARACFNFHSGAEITLEANPNDVLTSTPEDWYAAGINRVSLGVQSLNDEALTFLGRDHNSHQARKALSMVQTHFDNHSIDLIYAHPDQSLADWQEELSGALGLGAPHLSLYELTLEEKTAFGKRAQRGELIPLDDEAQADLYELTQSMCKAADLLAYEVSNHAYNPAYESRHNHIYWASGDWIGVGPGAHGRLTIDGKRYATEAARRPADYIAKEALSLIELTLEDTAHELLAMGLRPHKGLDLSRYEALRGSALPRTKLETFADLGLAVLTDETLCLTAAGRLLADRIATDLVT